MKTDTTTKKFCSANNLMVTNSLLQMGPITFISLALMLSTLNDYIWGFATMSFSGSFLSSILLVSSYETDYMYAGDYFNVINLYNNLAMGSTLSLFSAIFIYLCESATNSLFRELSVCISFVIGVKYLCKFLIRTNHW